MKSYTVSFKGCEITKSHTVYIVSYYQLEHYVSGEMWRHCVEVFEDVNSLAEFIVMLETDRDEYRFTSVKASEVPEVNR